MKSGARFQRAKERALIRALTIASGAPARDASRIMFGHSSDSAISAESGRQWAKKRRMKQRRVERRELVHRAAGRRGASSRAEVTVPVVISASHPLWVSRSTSGNSDTASPTLAPCSQTSGPGGRGRPAAPRRSSTRIGSSLPC